MGRLIVIAILVLPLAEIAAFVMVASFVGVGGAFLLMLATSLAGFLVLRQAGRASLERLRAAMGGAHPMTVEANASGLLAVLGGLLLFLPGFLTDLAGVALLIGPVRRWCDVATRRWMGSRRDPADRSTLDLAPEEWKQVPDRELSNPSNPRRD
ncbi:MAG: FxsA family protein [Hyphomicrobiales bacterium]|nr:FxsA family protein [Alphaproteobacteria bacterium]